MSSTVKFMEKNGKQIKEELSDITALFLEDRDVYNEVLFEMLFHTLSKNETKYSGEILYLYKHLVDLGELIFVKK